MTHSTVHVFWRSIPAQFSPFLSQARLLQYTPHLCLGQTPPVYQVYLLQNGNMLYGAGSRNPTLLPTCPALLHSAHEHSGICRLIHRHPLFDKGRYIYENVPVPFVLISTATMNLQAYRTLSEHANVCSGIIHNYPKMPSDWQAPASHFLRSINILAPMPFSKWYTVHQTLQASGLPVFSPHINRLNL